MHRASVRQASGKGEKGKIKCRTCELKHKDELKEQLFIDCLQMLKKKKKQNTHAHTQYTKTHRAAYDSLLSEVLKLLNCTKKKLFTKQTFISRMITQRAENTDVNPSN